MTERARLAASPKEVAAALELAARVHGPDHDEAKCRLDHIVQECESFSQENVVVVLDTDTVVGTLLMIPKKLRVCGVESPVLGIAYVSMDFGHRGRGLGRELMTGAVEAMHGRGMPFSALIARRAVDGFYSKFGYVGTGVFTTFQFPLLDPERSLDQSFAFSGSADSLDDYAQAYESTYVDVPMAWVRDAEWWRQLDVILSFRGVEFLDVRADSEFIGYVVVADDSIVEAAGPRGGEKVLCDAMLELVARRGWSELTLRVPSAHPCVDLLMRRNHTKSFRRPWDGGHMVRILDPDRAYTMLADHAETLLSRIVSPDVGKETRERIARHLEASRGAEDYGLLGLAQGVLLPSASRPILDTVDLLSHTWSPLDEF